MKILVTGGAGFIGSHVVDAYIAAGHQVAIIDNLSTGSRTNLNSRAVFYEADIRDRSLMSEIISKEKPDIINHHAAQAAVTVSGVNPGETYDVNVMGTLNLLLASAGIQKFIFISTGGALYGDLIKGQKPFTETSAPRPFSAYGLSKLLGEQLVAFYAKQMGFSHTIVRLANAYGPRQNPKGEAGICAIFSLLLSQGKQPTIYNKDATRDYVFVSDIAQVNLQILDKGDALIANIGTGMETTNQEIFEIIATEYGYTGTPRYEPARMNEVKHTAVDASLASRELNWKPTVRLPEGIKKIHAWQN
ncbi:MAG: GDP-mannose 4,6-dehydratase [bacterium]|nr:GDP-mannose 4,6-dehydratase [bacterium]